MKELEKLKLNYIRDFAKNRLAAVIDKQTGEKKASSRLDEIILCLDKNDFKAVSLELDKPKTVWVAVIQAQINGLEGERTIAIVMNASSY